MLMCCACVVDFQYLKDHVEGEGVEGDEVHGEDDPHEGGDICRGAGPGCVGEDDGPGHGAGEGAEDEGRPVDLLGGLVVQLVHVPEEVHAGVDGGDPAERHDVVAAEEHADLDDHEGRAHGVLVPAEAVEPLAQVGDVGGVAGEDDEVRRGGHEGEAARERREGDELALLHDRDGEPADRVPREERRGEGEAELAGGGGRAQAWRRGGGEREGGGKEVFPRWV
jgi:hypothetical protein